MFQFTSTGRFENHSERKVRAVRTPADDPNAVNYGDVLDAVLNEIESRKWKILEKRFALYLGDKVMAAGFELQIPGLRPKGLGVWLGITVGQTGRFGGLTFYAGCVDKKTGIGHVLGKVRTGRRDAETAPVSVIAQYLDEWLTKAQQAETKVEQMKASKLSDVRYAALLLAAFRHKAQTTRMAWKWGSFIDDFYRSSNDRTLWGLMLAVAHGVSKAHPAKQMEMLLAMRHVVKAELRRLKEAKSGA